MREPEDGEIGIRSEVVLAQAGQDVNLGIFDGPVSHAEINRSLTEADKSILFGEQTRLPYFPEDDRLPKLHAGDPLVLLFWKVFKKLPDTLRAALLDVPLSLSLVRGDSLLYFRDFRCHQAVHIGRRRRTIYLPETLLLQAEEKGYDYWAIAEGLIYAAWMLLDYLLLVEVSRFCQKAAQLRPGFRPSESLLHRLVEEHNHHRREHVEEGRSEVHEFFTAYRGPLLRLAGAGWAGAEPFDLAHRLFDPVLEQQWGRAKMERVAEVFNFPRFFLFDRDIIHGAAREVAQRRGQDLTPQCFAEALHDFRDARRFEETPLLTTLGRSVVPKPIAVLLQEVVRLGAEGLRGFFAAYRQGESDVVDLVHLLWIYLCALTSDPAGVYTRVGRCRALGRQGREEGLERAIAGILIRLDRAPGYEDLTAQVAGMGAPARAELEALVEQQRLLEKDEWATFKIKKQAIVARAVQALQQMRPDDRSVSSPPVRPEVHQDAQILQTLRDNPHRQTSDPSGVLMYLRSYQRSLAEFGPEDPDTNFFLASLLVRLDQSPHYEHLLAQIPALGPPGIAALYQTLEQIPERDDRRRPILEQTRLLLARDLLRHRPRSRKKVVS